jgi:hypothetical protein
VCCGIIGADARPNWQEQPPRESLTVLPIFNLYTGAKRMLLNQS